MAAAAAAAAAMSATTKASLRGSSAFAVDDDDINRGDLISSISSSWMSTNTDFSVVSCGTTTTTALTELSDLWNQVVAPRVFFGGDNNSKSSNNHDDDHHHWWKRLVELHSESHRAYHTLVHLRECVGFLKLMDQADNLPLVLSILFHDAIYDPTSGTNEEDSAKLFQEFCAEANLLDGALVDTVVRYILATKSHEHTNDDELSLFLDIDMAVLGKEEPAYLQYAALIRQEYSFVERTIYCEKRAEILEKFLESNIFGSTVMHQALEQRARSNLRKEIELLNAGVIPGDTKG